MLDKLTCERVNAKIFQIFFQKYKRLFEGFKLNMYDIVVFCLKSKLFNVEYYITSYMTNSFGLESAYHVTRMVAYDWFQVQNIMECNRRCHWGSPTIAEGSPTLKSYSCPVMDD